MLSIPVKKSQSSEGFGPALLTYIQRNYGEGEAARFRNLASSLDGARSASAEAAAELCRLESESSGESSAVAVARVALASGPDRSVEGAAVEACARDLRRYGVELLAAQRRVPDADSAMESFMCEWDDGWARSGAAADATTESWPESSACAEAAASPARASWTTSATSTVVPSSTQRTRRRDRSPWLKQTSKASVSVVVGPKHQEPSSK